MFNSTVLIWFLAHFHIDNRDWDTAKKYGNPYHPLWGYYKSNDLNILERQIDAIKRAKIDIMGYDVFPTYKLTPKDIAKDKVLPMVISRLEKQKEDKHKLKYCLIFENYIGYHTYEELSLALNYSYKNLIENEYYFKPGGKPFILIFWDEKNWGVIKKLQKEYKDFEINQVAWSWKGKEGWLYCENYPQTLRKDWMPVSPYFDSSLEEIYLRDMYIETKSDTDLNKLFKWYAEKSGGKDITDEEIRRNPLLKSNEDRGEGIAYEKQLTWAIKNNPEFIMISSWNDWHFQNQIEPAEEYGFKYIDKTSEILGKFGKE